MSVLFVCIIALQTNIVFDILGPKSNSKKLMHLAVNSYGNLVLLLLNDELMI